MRKISVLGLLALPWLVSCGGGGGGTMQMIAVTVSPASPNVAVGQMDQFTATVTGTSDTAVTWSVMGGAANGTISATGLYTAPAAVPNPPNVTVVATSQANAAKSGSAMVTVMAASPNVSVSVSPNPASVEVFESQQFNAAVTGSANTAVTWKVNGVTGGSATTGTISAGGLFSAPHSVPVKSVGGSSQTTTVSVTAVSQANSASSGSSVVTVAPPPGVQSEQPTPVVLGTSGGNINDKSVTGMTITCCGGTLGSLVTRGGTQFILSNNHVLARSDLATAGDHISQPGIIDVPNPNTCTTNGTTAVGTLTQFYNLETGALPHIDAAIAQVAGGAVDPNGKIFELGSTATSGVPDAGAPHQGPLVAATMNMTVAKSGRSTGLTCSTITGLNVTVNNVQYQKGCGTGAMFSVNYTGQVMVGGGAFSAEGDSGSLIVTQDTADPIALLYAGSDMDTVGNPVSDVLNFFKSGANLVTFVGNPTAHKVIGCTGPFPLTVGHTILNSLAGQVSTASSEKKQRAIAVRDAHKAELMAHPEAQAVGVGASFDNAEEPAILFFVTRGAPRTGIPAEVDGVRTRIIEGDLFKARGILTESESAALEQAAGAPQMAYSLSDSELSRALGVQAAHQGEWVAKPGVQAVGVTSSVDSPGEAALLIYLVRGQTHEPIPVLIEGLRTRVRVGSAFKAGLGGAAPGASCTVRSSGTAPAKAPAR
jgi:hypothetical protein